jgi:hypothetical protein
MIAPALLASLVGVLVWDAARRAARPPETGQPMGSPRFGVEVDAAAADVDVPASLPRRLDHALSVLGDAGEQLGGWQLEDFVVWACGVERGAALRVTVARGPHGTQVAEDGLTLWLPRGEYSLDEAGVVHAFAVAFVGAAPWSRTLDEVVMLARCHVRALEGRTG